MSQQSRFLITPVKAETWSVHTKSKCTLVTIVKHINVKCKCKCKCGHSVYNQTRRRCMPLILPIRRKTQSNQSINNQTNWNDKSFRSYDWLIDWIVFYAVSANFMLYYVVYTICYELSIGRLLIWNGTPIFTTNTSWNLTNIQVDMVVCTQVFAWHNFSNVQGCGFQIAYNM